MTGSDVELDALEEKKKKKKKRKVKKRKGGKKDGKGASSKGYSLRDWFKGGGWVQTGGKYDGKCRKVGAKNWGNKSKKNESTELVPVEPKKKIKVKVKRKIEEGI